MTTSELIEEFESSRILIDLRGAFELPELGRILDEVGDWLDNYCTVATHDGTTIKMYLRDTRGLWEYAFIEECDERCGNKFINCANSNYFKFGAGSHWEVHPTVVKLVDFYQMIVNTEALSESCFDEVFG